MVGTVLPTNFLLDDTLLSYTFLVDGMFQQELPHCRLQYCLLQYIFSEGFIFLKIKPHLKRVILVLITLVWGPPSRVCTHANQSLIIKLTQAYLQRNS